MNADWLKLPTVTERYAAFRATLNLKKPEDAYGSRAGDDEEPPKHLTEPAPGTPRKLLNLPKRKTD
jgi:hypothetical protein